MTHISICRKNKTRDWYIATINVSCPFIREFNSVKIKHDGQYLSIMRCGDLDPSSTKINPKKASDRKNIAAPLRICFPSDFDSLEGNYIVEKLNEDELDLIKL